MKTLYNYLPKELVEWLNLPLFRPIDRQCARFLADRFDADTVTAMSGALASAMVVLGHSYVPIDLLAGTRWPEGEEENILLPEKKVWMDSLKRSSAVGGAGEHTPLILDGEKLYLGKYFRYEENIAARLAELAVIKKSEISSRVFDLAKLLFTTEKDFSRTGGDLQAAGAFLPFYSRLSIISGGPGTGKTTVLSKMLALQCQQALATGVQMPVIRLAAPTGKAAQRMAESIRNSPDLKRTDPQIAAHISVVTPTTMHRLLGISGNTPKPRFNRERRLDADIIVVDESSMMDVTLFTKLLNALSDSVRIILLGDRYQLSSVDAGSVMADICNAFPPNYFTAGYADMVNSILPDRKNHLSPSDGAVMLSPLVELQHSFRFEGAKPIGLVSNSIKNGSSAKANALLLSDQSETDSCTLSAHPAEGELTKLILKNYAPLFGSSSPEQAIDTLGKFMVLTAVNEGRYGREGINRMVRNALGQDIPVRPIKITENDYQNRLFNGDMGVIIQQKESDGTVIEFAYFPEIRTESGNASRPQNSVRKFIVGMLPPHTDAFAITIHNSQGSEFESVMIILPEKDRPILTSELLYTAVTRAKSRAQIFGSSDIVKLAVERKVVRYSGLEERLRKIIGA